jgi:hypothetical protein
MCTVLFIPNNNEKYFASLRDESPLRPEALAPILYNENNMNILSTKDPLAGGTWIGINNFQNVVILLNGAFEAHLQLNQYTKSRGLIVAELLRTEMPVIEWSFLDLSNVEPFTLVIWSDYNLFELVWDGANKYRKLLDQTIPHIWSSSTLYNKQAKQNREVLFKQWIYAKPNIEKDTIMRFFSATIDPENGFIINRKDKVKTLSFSLLSLAIDKHAVFEYDDLKNQEHYIQSIAFKTQSINCSTLN